MTRKVTVLSFVSMFLLQYHVSLFYIGHQVSYAAFQYALKFGITFISYALINKQTTFAIFFLPALYREF